MGGRDKGLIGEQQQNRICGMSNCFDGNGYGAADAVLVMFVHDQELSDAFYRVCNGSTVVPDDKNGTWLTDLAGDVRDPFDECFSIQDSELLCRAEPARGTRRKHHGKHACGTAPHYHGRRLPL